MPLAHDSIFDDEHRQRPPAARAGRGGGLLWAITLLLLAVLAVGAWRAWDWLNADVQRRRAIAAGQLAADERPRGAAQVSGSVTLPAERPAAANAADAVSPARTWAGGAGAAPNATGIAGVNKCVMGAQVTYTNAPCPVAPAPAVRTAESDAPVAAAANAGDARRAACAYLSAELARLEHEFRQPLPPPVIDHIATRLDALRAHGHTLRCAMPAAARGH